MNRILFTNDDGYSSVALHDLYHYVSEQFPDASRVMMAPHINRSGISHAITLGKPLIYREREPHMFEVEGYPADCTLVAYGVMGMPDLIISGPNFGSNLGQDVLYSGTIGAAREGALHNTPAIAFSFVDEEDKLDRVNYDNWHAFLDKWLHPLIKLASNHRGSIVNVNVCNPIGLELVEGTLGSRYYYNYQSYEEGMDHKGKYFAAIPEKGQDLSREVEAGSDVFFVRQGLNVFNVFSSWPKLKTTMLDELKTYQDGSE